MPSEIQNSPQTPLPSTEKAEVLQSVLQRIDALEEDNLHLKLRCEDLEDENETLKEMVKTISWKLDNTVKEVKELQVKGASVSKDYVIQSAKALLGGTAAKGWANHAAAHMPSSLLHLAKDITPSVDRKQMPPTIQTPQQTPIKRVRGDMSHEKNTPSYMARGTDGKANHATSSHATTPKNEEGQQKLATLCGEKKWNDLLHFLQEKPSAAATSFCMGNKLFETTTLHQLFVAKGDQKLRAQIIELILDTQPECARKSNSYNSLPLYAFCQRKTVDFHASMWNKMLFRLMDAYPEALLSPGGHSQKTPLHILIRITCSHDIINEIIKRAPQCLQMKDKEGCLPIHLYCRVDCYIGRLQMLVEAWPGCVFVTNNEGDTPLSVLMKACEKRRQDNDTCIHYLRNKMLIQQQAVEIAELPSTNLEATDAETIDEPPSKRARENVFNSESSNSNSGGVDNTWKYAI